MKITEWLGWNDEASSYLLRRGELRSLVNLQPARRGMLITRSGMLKVFGEHDGERIMGMYRKITPFGSPDVIVILQRAVRVSEDLDTADTEIWRVSRLTGLPFQSQMIDEQVLSPNGLTNITNMSVAEDRHGRLFIFYGHGAKPVMYRPDLAGTLGVELGMEAPLIQPTVIPEGEGYFIERVDVTAGGGSYWGPPTITVEGGDPERAATLKGIVQAGNLVAVDVVDGGASYKTFPKVVVGTDKIGVGFRGVGVLETDPGIQGFIETVPGTTNIAHSPFTGETFGLNNLLDGNSILYLSSPAVLTTTATAPNPVPNPYTQMVVGSVSGVKVGDLVSVRGATTPAPFADPKTVVRVLAISSTNNAHTITLSKAWQPSAGITYQVLFRRDWSLASAPAVYDPATYRFKATIPLNTLTGVGQGAEATITFTPKADGYALGPVSQQGFTTPTGGPSASRFAFKEVGWDNYAAFTDDYWKGNASPGDEKAPEKQLREYTGLQASGKQFVYGYTGATGKKTGRRGDVYFPDYSEISVWLCVGRYEDKIANWKRVDAKVYNGNTAEPYALVTLEPALKGLGEPPSRRKSIKGQPKQNSPGFSSTKQRGKQPNIAYTKADDYRPPVIRINLKRCPDSWVTTYNAGDTYNLTNWLKNEQASKVAWWNQAALTPRPLVDFRGSNASARLDWGTIEVVDAGSGLEKDTLFALRLYQANPYEQVNDFNYKARPEVTPTTGKRRNRARAHQPFSKTTRYCEFVLRATLPDATQTAGPPAEIAGPQVVDVSGQSYRAGDVAAVTLLKRPLSADVESAYMSFTGYLSFTFADTEFTYDATLNSLTGTYNRPANSKTLTVTVGSTHNLTVGDRVRLDFTSGTAQDGDYNIVSATATAFTVEHQFASGAVAATGNVAITGSSFWPRQAGGCRIERSSGGSLTDSTVATRSIIKCRKEGVLFDFSQVMIVANGGVRLDKTCYPLPGIVSAISCTVANTNQTVNGQVRTLLTNVPTSVSGTSIESMLVPGQKVWLDAALISPRDPEILEVVRTENAANVSLWVAATASASGSANIRWAFDFDVYTGARQSQTIEWTAAQVVAGDSTQKVTSIRVLSSGKNYYAAPVIEFRGGGQGYGLDVTAEVEDGKVSALTVVDPGRDWTQPPEVYTSDAAATAVPVMRPALRGRYRCAYRFVDRSETVLKTVTITGVEGDDAVKVTVSDGSGLKPGMIFDSARAPFATKIASVSGNQVTLSAAATGSGQLSRVVIESGGSGYALDETVTVSLPTTKPDGWEGDWPTPTATFSATLEATSDGTGYQVRNATVTSAGSSLYPTGQVPLVFSRPVSGGTPATGYACITAFDTSASYDKTAIIRDMEKPVSYSNFSPILDVDAGPSDERESASKLVWTLPGVTPPARADMVEFYRTSADQSLVFYRLDIYGLPTEDGVQIVGEDTLTDEELFDPDRANYAAVPVVLPNGSLNAYRFGQPRTDMSACVAFQDRLWYGVSTSGQDANTIYYSEYDEFESCPDANELPIQNNYRSTDSITALAPFGSMLLAMQTSHTYAVTYNADPGIDAAVQMISHRGCLNQRCWDIYENIIYAADETGIYAMNRGGEVENLSLPIRDYFTQELLDFANRESFHLKVCERTKVLRFFCSLAAQPSGTPTHAFCYHIEQKTWWAEQYPNSICSAVAARPSPLRVSSTLYGATDGNIYELAGHSDVAYRSIVGVNITNPGAGYKTAPKITAHNGQGAIFQGVVSEGQLVDVLVLAGGWGYYRNAAVLTEAGDFLVAENGSRLTYGTEMPLELDIEAPPAVGPSLLAEDGRTLVTQAGDRLRQGDDSPAAGFAVVATPEEVVTTASFTSGLGTITLSQADATIVPGMEAFSPHLPQGCVVRSVNGTTVVVEHADGTTAQALQTITGGQVRFFKKFCTNIPFLLSTGNLEVANEANAPRGGGALIDRSVTVLYGPTEGDKYLELLEYYNGSTTPRSNVHRRNRGGPGGFEHRQDGASTVLNVSAAASHLASATGVAKATFAGRANEDATGTDRHLRVELYGRPTPANGNVGELAPQKLVLHSLTIDGVVENGE